jgi:hypothetical protein
VLTLYGLASAFIFVWVPWRGGPTMRGANSEVLGYGFVWSGPRRPAAFVEYDKRLLEYEKDRNKPNPDPTSLYRIEPPHPKEPEGYSSYSYKAATSTVDYGRILLEFGFLAAILLVTWMVIYDGTTRS